MTPVKGIIQYLPICLASSAQHVLQVHPGCNCVSASFLFMAEYYSTAWTDHILLIHSCVKDDIFGTVTVYLAPTSVLTTAL